MTSREENALRLSNPPIYEVVCGVHYESIEGLDALTQGLYWSTIRDQFPEKEVKLPLSNDAYRLEPHPGRIRSWFTSSSENFLIQLQDDRFYLNWRRSGDKYPRFRPDGDSDGVADAAIKKFDSFRSFCRDHLDCKLTIRKIELAKINLLIRDEHWKSLEELGDVIPALDGVFSLLDDSEPQGAFRFVSPADTQVRTEIQTVKLESSENDEVKQGIRVEFRTWEEFDEVAQLQECLENANQRLNSQFCELFPDARTIFA